MWTEGDTQDSSKQLRVVERLPRSKIFDMEATNKDMDWARAKLRWVLERIAQRLEQEAEGRRLLAMAIRGRA